jgi:Putative DNA-binding domain
MINVPFNSIDQAVIESLLLNEVREGRTLDYKEALPPGGRDDRKEFLADVTAFANGAGGDIVYGVTERRENNRPTGVPEAVTGLAGINADAAILQLESVIRDGVEPRISGLHFKVVDGFPSGPVIVLRIPKSWSSPHMVKLGDSRFYSRNNAGKYALDVAQIRSAFAFSDALPERVRRFREERIARIVAEETPIPLPSGHAKVVLHLLPVVALDPTTRIDTAPLRCQTEKLPPINANGWNNRHNLDGFLVHSGHGNPQTPTTYLQVFRSGAIEAVESMLLEYNNHHDRRSGAEPQNLIGSIAVERILIVALQKFLKVEQELGLEPPIFVMLSLVAVKGYGILSEWTHYESTYRFDRDTLLLPDTVMESYDEPADKLLQPAFDAMWQAAGFECCRHYKEGRWSDNTDGRPSF